MNIFQMSSRKAGTLSCRSYADSRLKQSICISYNGRSRYEFLISKSFCWFWSLLKQDECIAHCSVVASYHWGSR